MSEEDAVSHAKAYRDPAYPAISGTDVPKWVPQAVKGAYNLGYDAAQEALTNASSSIHTPANARAYPHYFLDVSNVSHIDVYWVMRALKMVDPGQQHAFKKLWAAGKRGAKNYNKDIYEAIVTLERTLEILKTEAVADLHRVLPGIVDSVLDSADDKPMNIEQAKRVLEKEAEREIISRAQAVVRLDREIAVEKARVVEPVVPVEERRNHERDKNWGDIAMDTIRAEGDRAELLPGAQTPVSTSGYLVSAPPAPERQGAQLEGTARPSKGLRDYLYTASAAGPLDPMAFEHLPSAHVADHPENLK